MKIKEANQYSDLLLDNINKLIPQLSESAELLTRQKLEDIIYSKNSLLFIAEIEGRIIGMSTLVTIIIPTTIKALIEDVVVDKKYLGKGIGKELTLHAINVAKENNVNSINLTSSPWRTAANALYKKLGFEKRETNVYRLEL